MGTGRKSAQNADKVTGITLIVDGDGRFAVLFTDDEGPVLHVKLNIFIIHFASNESLSVENSIFWVGVEGVFGAVSDTGKLRV